MSMRRILCVVFLIILVLVGAYHAFDLGVVYAGAPPLSASELADVPASAVSAINQEAHWIWAVLASPLAVAALTWLARMVDDWLREHRLLRENAELLEIYNFVSYGVGTTYDTFVHPLKHPEDGTKRKLTEADIKRAQDLAKASAVAHAKTKGVDLLKRVGPDLFRKMIEQVISDRKAGRYVTGPLAPLPELQP